MLVHPFHQLAGIAAGTAADPMDGNSSSEILRESGPLGRRGFVAAAVAGAAGLLACQQADAQERRRRVDEEDYGRERTTGDDNREPQIRERTGRSQMPGQDRMRQPARPEPRSSRERSRTRDTEREDDRGDERTPQRDRRSQGLTTQALGEEGSDRPRGRRPTTLALEEEGSGGGRRSLPPGRVTTFAIGEEGGDFQGGPITTQALFEEG